MPHITIILTIDNQINEWAQRTPPGTLVNSDFKANLITFLDRIDELIENGVRQIVTLNFSREHVSRVVRQVVPSVLEKVIDATIGPEISFGVSDSTIDDHYLEPPAAKRSCSQDSGSSHTTTSGDEPSSSTSSMITAQDYLVNIITEQLAAPSLPDLNQDSQFLDQLMADSSQFIPMVNEPQTVNQPFSPMVTNSISSVTMATPVENGPSSLVRISNSPEMTYNGFEFLDFASDTTNLEQRQTSIVDIDQSDLSKVIGSILFDITDCDMNGNLTN